MRWALASWVTLLASIGHWLPVAALRARDERASGERLAAFETSPQDITLVSSTHVVLNERGALLYFAGKALSPQSHLSSYRA
jgi:hypothetical protein